MMNSLGDLARSYALRFRNTELRQEITQYNNELTTGMASDIASHLGGSYARLTGIERDIRLIEGFQLTVNEARQYSDIVQDRLEQVGNIASDYANNLLLADFSSAQSTTTALSEAGRLHLSTVVDALNAQSAGRNLFSGDATDQMALVSGEEILNELSSLVATAVNPADVTTTIENWFDDPSGFEAFAYSGSATSLAPFAMSETSHVGVDIKANDPALKDVMKALSIAALSTQPGLSLTFDDQSELLRESSERLLSAKTDVVGLQAMIGLVQEQAEGWAVRHEVERLNLNNAKGDLLAVDPFETASRLQAAQFQLESLYSVTVRSSELSLVNYLR